MSKQFVNRPFTILESSGSLAANGSISGSAECKGYGTLRGLLRTDAATTSGSGVIIEQSPDSGENWYLVSASDAVGASAIVSYDLAIVGNAVRVTACNGAATANIQATFYLLP